MMDGPFFGSQWNLPSRSRRYPAARQVVPVQRQMPVPSPKVVAIPVHFAGSERSRLASAVKIQKVFRGFLVRKSMKRIVAVNREVDEVERRISREEVVDLIRRDSKERLKVNETLMSLLFRLDSVRGVDSGVRDCRKAVIRRAIALQEKVDAITAYEPAIASEETSDSASEMLDGSRSEAIDGIEESSARCDSAVGETLEIEDNVDGALQLQNPEGPVLDSGEYRVMSTDESQEKMDVSTIGEGSKINANKDDSSSKETVENSGDSALYCCEDSADVIKNDVDVAKVIDELKESMDVTEVRVGSEINSKEESSAPEDMVEDPKSDPLMKECLGVEGNPEQEKVGQRNGEILEKIMDGNEKLMGLMTKLFEKNEAQTRLLCSLSQRVEQLERAFMCEKLRKKKKRQGAAGHEGSPDPRNLIKNRELCRIL